MADEVRYVALLRGINVGGKHKLPMATLRAGLDAAGCTDVATYIQSGNVVLTPPSPAPADPRGWVEEVVALEKVGRRAGSEPGTARNWNTVLKLAAMTAG